MVLALTRTGMASPADATVLAVASRLWLTLLELGPGLIFLAIGALPSHTVTGGPVVERSAPR